MSSEKMSWAAANLKYAYGRVTIGEWDGKKVRVLLSSVHGLEAEVSLVVGPHDGGTRLMSLEEIVFDDPVVVAKAMEENFLRQPSGGS